MRAAACDRTAATSDSAGCGRTEPGRSAPHRAAHRAPPAPHLSWPPSRAGPPLWPLPARVPGQRPRPAPRPGAAPELPSQPERRRPPPAPGTMVLDKEDGKWAGPGRGEGGGRERAVRGLTRGPGRPPPAGYRRGFAGLGASRPRWARGWRPRSVPARPGSGCAPGAGLQLGKSEYGAAGGSGFVRGSSAGFPLSRSPLSFGRGASAPARCEPARRGAVRNRGAAAGLRRFRSRGPAPPGPGSRRGRPSETSDYAGGAPLGPPRCRSRTRAWRRRGSELPRPGRAPKDPLVRPPRAEGKRGKRRPRGTARVMPCGCGEELSLGGDLAQNGAMQVLLGCCAEWGGGGRRWGRLSSVSVP